MAEIFIPTLHTFENGNVFTGSSGRLRFRIAPKIVELNKKEVDLAASSLRCELWYGEKCYELSDIEEENTFPMSEEGCAELQVWLTKHAV